MKIFTDNKVQNIATVALLCPSNKNYIPSKTISIVYPWTFSFASYV